MPIPVLLALAAAASIYQGVKGAQQASEANDLRKRDTTPQSQREALALARQAQAGALPGGGTALNRIEAGTNDTLSAAARVGTSSNSVLGLLQQSDNNRLRALADLGSREDAFHQQENRALTGALDRQAGYEARDQTEFDRNRAALKEASERNIYGAINGLSQVGAYGLNQSQNGPAPTTGDATTTATRTGLSPLGPDAVDPTTGRRVRYNQYGIYDPTGGYYPGAGY